jgi:hypothetical protein
MTHLVHRLHTLIAIMAIACALPAFAQSVLRIEQVEFAQDTTRTFADSIGGFEAVSYRINLKDGQVLDISLSTNNLSNCFDVFAPGTEKPFFVGDDSGTSHHFLAKRGGEYVVKVYLLRLAARDNQSAHFTLELKISD